MGITRPHTHWCPRCEQDKACEATRDSVGCIIGSASPVTCHDCEVEIGKEKGWINDDPNTKGKDHDE